jgi:GNAT superfamily N-acetyltransferase
MSEQYTIRSATEADIPALVSLRRALFKSMGYQEPALTRVAQASSRYFATAIPQGEFRAWVAEADSETVASGGLVIHAIPPTTYNLAGREGYIMNMYTRPEWRRQGIGAAILQAMLDYLREHDISLVSLHATPDGRRLYAQYGFEPTNEMRLHFETV